MLLYVQLSERRRVLEGTVSRLTALYEQHLLQDKIMQLQRLSSETAALRVTISAKDRELRDVTCTAQRDMDQRDREGEQQCALINTAKSRHETCVNDVRDIEVEVETSVQERNRCEQTVSELAMQIQGYQKEYARMVTGLMPELCHQIAAAQV